MNISYDKIAADYAIHRSVQPNLLRKLIEFPRIASSSRILEVGCGTGNYISSIASLTSAKCFGIEPSSGMLAEARKNAAPVSWSQGAGEAIPYPDDSFDFVFSADVIHHVRDRLAFFKDAFRVLGHGGWFATATDSEKTIRSRMPLSHYFPETIDPELRRYPEEQEIQQLLASRGFDRISDELIEFAYSLSDSAPFERKAFSCLHLISEDAFARGIRHLKQDLEAGPIPCISRCVVYWGHKS